MAVHRYPEALGLAMAIAMRGMDLILLINEQLSSEVRATLPSKARRSAQ
jgi:hypothetical protein